MPHRELSLDELKSENEKKRWDFEVDDVVKFILKNYPNSWIEERGMSYSGLYINFGEYPDLEETLSIGSEKLLKTRPKPPITVEERLDKLDRILKDYDISLINLLNAMYLKYTSETGQTLHSMETIIKYNNMKEDEDWTGCDIGDLDDAMG